MTSIARIHGLVLVSLMMVGCQSAPVGPALHGAWRVTKAETILPDGIVREGPVHESILLFTDGFYSMG